MSRITNLLSASSKFRLLSFDLLSITCVSRQLIGRFPSQVLYEIIHFAATLQRQNTTCYSDRWK